MRTTIRLNDHLLRDAKQLAARSGRTLTSIIEEALRTLLAKPQRAAKRTRVQLTTVRGRGPAAGVDLDDTAGLLDLMEDRRGSH